VKLPEGVWGDVSKKLVVLYGVDIYKSWFSKLTAIVDETTKTIELKATSEFIKDWIVSNYGDVIAKIVAGMNFELKNWS
jgi:chromosomal replication initiation ATPase DnaA